MADEMDRSGEALRPATHDEARDSLAFAMRYQGRKYVHDPEVDSFMARIAAERLCEHSCISGFVILKKPLAAVPDAARIGPACRQLED